MDERMQVGVRALLDGHWGFAAGGHWSRDEMVRLGRAAVHQAKANAVGPRGRGLVTLAPVAPVMNGHWATPVVLDPFVIDPALIYDILRSTERYIESHRPWPSRIAKHHIGADYHFHREAKAFASTAGSYYTQRLDRSWGRLEIRLERTDDEDVRGHLDSLSPTGRGFELYRDQDLRAVTEQLLDELLLEATLPVAPVEVGRYDTVFDARAVAALLDQTLGRATELDRAMGYEANATGTSYLDDPLRMVGSYPVAAPSITVTANRTEPGGCATVQWDDEGVAPEPDGFTLVQDGILTDFQTTRESAPWLHDYYTAARRPERSHACAAAPAAIYAPLVHTPNLVLAPGRDRQDVDDLIGTLKNGIALKSWGTDLSFDMDFQSLNGLGDQGVFYKVKDGRRVARLKNAGLLFRSPELWKGVLALGGPASRRRYGLSATKGEPPQATYHSVTAPPALFQQLTLIDTRRKA